VAESEYAEPKVDMRSLESAINDSLDEMEKYVNPVTGVTFDMEVYRTRIAAELAELEDFPAPRTVVKRQMIVKRTIIRMIDKRYVFMKGE
jgi:hypothetical protein